MQRSPEAEPPVIETTLEDEEQPLTDITEFDLDSFFAAESGPEEIPSEVVVTLRQKSEEVVETFAQNVSAESFEKSSVFLSGALSVLSPLLLAFRQAISSQASIRLSNYLQHSCRVQAVELATSLASDLSQVLQICSLIACCHNPPRLKRASSAAL